jgi:hypothetical protein
MAYSKLYSSIVHSSLWTEPDHIRILFITLLAIADREGFVYGSRNGLMRLANLNPDHCAEVDPFQALMDPDKDSSDLLRNPENEGRRIEAVPGGFLLLNFAYYRGLFDDEDRREQNRLAQARHREKLKSMTVSESKQQSADVSESKPSAPAPSPKRVNTSSDNTLPVNKSGKSPCSRSSERLLLGSLETILHTGEMESNGAIWRMRIRSGKKERKALRNAIEDFSARTPDQQAKIHNRAAWLTDRYERCLKESAC